MSTELQKIFEEYPEIETLLHVDGMHFLPAYEAQARYAAIVRGVKVETVHRPKQVGKKDIANGNTTN